MTLKDRSRLDEVSGKRRALRAAVVRIGECLLGIPLHEARRGSATTWWGEPESAHETYYENTARTVDGRTPEQSEFWFTDVVGGMPQAVSAVQAQEDEDPFRLAWEDAMPAAPISAAEDAPVVDAEPQRRTSEKPAVQDVPATYAERRRFASMLNVGRFLMLGGTLESSPRDRRRLALPRNPFRPKPRLWNEPAEIGCSDRTLRFPPCDLSSHGPRRADGNLIF